MVIENSTTIGDSSIPDECGVAERKRGVAIFDAAAGSGRIARERAICNRQAAAILVLNTTADGRGISRETGTVDQERRIVALDAAAESGCIAGDVAVGETGYAAVLIVDATPINICGIVRNCAAMKQKHRVIILDTAAVSGGIAEEGGIGQRNQATVRVVNATAIVAGCVAANNRLSDQHGRGVVIYTAAGSSGIIRERGRIERNHPTGFVANTASLGSPCSC